jgi:hypothetical protein
MPFMGINASGQLGKSIVHFNWKGIHAVRSHVIPANPNSADQQTVRTDFTDQVNAWHNADMLAADKEAWNRFAGVSKRAASGFNEMVSYFRKWYTDSNEISHIRSVVVTVNTGGTLTVTAKSDGTTGTPRLYYGTSKTYMPDFEDGAGWTEGADSFTLTGMVAGTKLFFYILDEVVDPGPPIVKDPYGRTGIFAVTIEA